MKRTIAAMAAAFFFLMAAWVFDLGYIIAILIWTITAITFVVGSVLCCLWLLAAWEKYRTIRAGRLKEEREAQVKVIQAGDKVFISDLNHNAWWRAAHLDPRVYANSQSTYEQATDFERQAWLEHNRPKVIEQSVKQITAGSDNETLPTFYSLLDSYPHLMLLGATNSGKTVQAAAAAKYRFSQRSNAILIWLSTHAGLDAPVIPSKTIILGSVSDISKCLQDLLRCYQKRREGGNYRHIVLVIDEWPEIVDELKDLDIKGGDILRRLSRGGRKTGFSLILASHGGTVNDLDTAGHSSVKQDFAQVYLSPKFTQQGKAIWQQFNKKSSQVEIALPGLFASEDERIREAINRLGPNVSKREISEEVWGTGKFGSYYNEKIERVK